MNLEDHVDEIVLTIPARSDYIALARSLIAGIAAKRHLTIDEIEDLRLATDEAATHLTAESDDAQELRITIRAEDSRVEVSVRLDRFPAARMPSSPDETLTWQILTGLVDEAGFQTIDGGAAIRFAKRIAFTGPTG